MNSKKKKKKNGIKKEEEEKIKSVIIQSKFNLADLNENWNHKENEDSKKLNNNFVIVIFSWWSGVLGERFVLLGKIGLKIQKKEIPFQAKSKKFCVDF